MAARIGVAFIFIAIAVIACVMVSEIPAKAELTRRIVEGAAFLLCAAGVWLIVAARLFATKRR